MPPNFLGSVPSCKGYGRRVQLPPQGIRVGDYPVMMLSGTSRSGSMNPQQVSEEWLRGVGHDHESFLSTLCT